MDAVFKIEKIVVEQREIAIEELYPSSAKFLVFHHPQCNFFWVSKGASSSEAQKCPECVETVRAVSAFSELADAKAFKNELLVAGMQLKIEVHQMMRGDFKNQSPFSSIRTNFFEKWLLWQFPNAEVNQFRTQVSELRFQPDEKFVTIEESLEDHLKAWEKFIGALKK